MRLYSCAATAPLQAVLPLPLLALALLSAPARAQRGCAANTYSYDGVSCSPCAAVAAFVVSSGTCTPPGPAIAAFYLSGTQAEGVAAFTSFTSPPLGATFVADHLGAANGALYLETVSYTHLTLPTNREV